MEEGAGNGAFAVSPVRNEEAPRKAGTNRRRCDHAARGFGRREDASERGSLWPLPSAAGTQNGGIVGVHLHRSTRVLGSSAMTALPTPSPRSHPFPRGVEGSRRAFPVHDASALSPDLYFATCANLCATLS